MSINICRQCDEEFEGHYARWYCSEECKYDARHKTKDCPECGESFDTPNNNENKFCSFGCFLDHQGRQQNTSNSERKLLQECAGCGNLFEYKAGSRPEYCSSECQEQYEEEKIPDKESEDQNHEVQKQDAQEDEAQSNKQTLRKCAECNHLFLLDKNDRKQKFCSKVCRLNYQHFYNTQPYDVKSSECENCGGKTGQDQQYCSEHCYRQDNNHTNSVSSQECKSCGKSFYGVSTAEYCSDSCRTTLKVCVECDQVFELPTPGTPHDYCSTDCKLSDLKDTEGKTLDPADYRREVVKRGVNVDKQDVQRMLEMQDGQCVYCGENIDDGYHIDHKIPISRGGGHHWQNLQLTCPDCNIDKGSLTHKEYK